MPQYTERKQLFYTREQLFDIVSDIGSYQKFLPWCICSKILKRNKNILYTELTIGFKILQEKYTSKVTLLRPYKIDVEYLTGPFKYLNTYWIFERDSIDPLSTWLDLFVDFELRSVLLQKIIGVVFSETVKMMVSAFENRAKECYRDNTATLKNN